MGDYKMSKKNRIPAFDFVRAICAVGIIANHYSIESQNVNLQSVMSTFICGNGSVGYTLVTVFLIISGALLYYNHQSVNSIRKFYLSRARAILPSYYITYLFAAAGAFVFNHSFFTRQPFYTFPLTLIGMDGYFAGIIPTWRLIGEWFVGAVIILYIAYPFILKGINKNEILLSLSAVTLFFLAVDWHMLEQNPFRNIFSLLITFVFGMLISKCGVADKPGLGIWGILTFCMIYCIPFELDMNISSHLAGFSLFVFLYKVGNNLMNNKYIEKTISKISSVSYEMFLIQRIVIVYSLRIVHPNSTLFHIVLLLLVIVLTFVGAIIIKSIKDRLITVCSKNKFMNKVVKREKQ